MNLHRITKRHYKKTTTCRWHKIAFSVRFLFVTFYVFAEIVSFTTHSLVNRELSYFLERRPGDYKPLWLSKSRSLGISVFKRLVDEYILGILYRFVIEQI